MPRSSRLAALGLLALALALAAGGCKADKKKCEAACRNHYTLVFEEQLAAELARAPETCAGPAPPPGVVRALEQAQVAFGVDGTFACVDRATLATRRRGEMPSRLENGIALCVESCVSAGNDDQMDCLVAAKTAKAARACVE